MGLAKTLNHIQQSFFWEGMRRDTQQFIKQCIDCLQTKYVPQKPTGLLQPTPQPSRPWEDLALDFVTGLPNYQGATVIMTIVDRFSKGPHFGTLSTHFMAHMVVQLFINLVCKLHGFPRSLISNRDPIFISRFWCELFRLSGTKLRMSTAYHPRATARRRCSTASWNSTMCHSSTNLSPYEVTYNKPLSGIPDYLPGSSIVEAVDFLLSSR